MVCHSYVFYIGRFIYKFGIGKETAGIFGYIRLHLFQLVGVKAILPSLLQVYSLYLMAFY